MGARGAAVGTLYGNERASGERRKFFHDIQGYQPVIIGARSERNEVSRRRECNCIYAEIKYNFRWSSPPSGLRTDGKWICAVTQPPEGTAVQGRHFYGLYINSSQNIYIRKLHYSRLSGWYAAGTEITESRSPTDIPVCAPIIPGERN